MSLIETLRKSLPQLRGTLQGALPMSGISWFRTGGPAEVLFSPADEEELSSFLKILPPEVPLTVVGLGSNLIVRDGGIKGVVIRLSAKALARFPPKTVSASAQAPPPPMCGSPRRRLRRGSQGLPSIAAFPAPSAARCA